jgi:hypothetical protein
VSLETVTPPVFGKENYMASPFKKGDSVISVHHYKFLPTCFSGCRRLPNRLAVLLCICALLLTPILVSLVSSAPARAISVLTLSPNKGSFGTVITVTGSGFPADTNGWVWFDSDKDSTRDDEEPQIEVTTTGTGYLPAGTTLTVPELTPGSYRVLADIPVGGINDGFGFFTYTGTYISLDPTSGYSGTVITVIGGNFTADSTGWVWFDTSRDGNIDPEEPQIEVSCDAEGDFEEVTLTAPTLTQGTDYWVRADIPEGGSYEASAIFKCPLATTELTVTKYDAYGTVLDSATRTYLEMEAGLPVQGDATTDRYHQGPTFDDSTFETLWDTGETENVDSRNYGSVRGTDVKDLCQLVGGVSPGDVIRIKASDNWFMLFDYEDVYDPEPEQGKMVVCWYSYDYGGYPPTYDTGMRLIFFAETTNPDGKYVFGNWDMHQTLAKSRWYYYDDIWPSSSGLSGKYVSDIEIYQPNLISCDGDGNPKESFAPGDTVYVKGLGLDSDTDYNIWIQREGGNGYDEVYGVIPDDALITGDDPSETQEAVTTDEDGDFGPLAIWEIGSSATSSVHDIVADNQDRGTVGTFESADAIDCPGREGFAVVAEFISFTIEDYDDNGIVFGDLDPGQSGSADWGDGEGAVTIIIGAETNVDVEVQVMGTDFNRDGGGGTILIGDAHIRYDDDNPPDEERYLSNDYVTWYSVDANTSDVRQVYYWITIPSGQSAGDYESTFYYRAIKSE